MNNYLNIIIKDLAINQVKFNVNNRINNRFTLLYVTQNRKNVEKQFLNKTSN
jgi:hypothetical protein